MSKGTILHHFGSKDRLLEHVHTDYMERRLAEAHALLARLETPPDQLAGLVYQLMLAEHHDRAATVAFAREIMRFASEDVMSDVRRMRHEYSDLMHAVIQRGMDEGRFAQADAGDRDAAGVRHVQLELDVVPAGRRVERGGHRRHVHARHARRARRRRPGVRAARRGRRASCATRWPT